MIENIINFSIRYRWLVLLAALGVAGLGAYNFEHLPIDAVPDITNVQVQINTAAYGLSAPEIEQRITYTISDQGDCGDLLDGWTKPAPGVALWMGKVP